MVDYPISRGHRTGGTGSEVVEVRDKTRPINGWKLKHLLSYKGTQTEIAEELGFCQATISKAICRERISYALAGLLEERYGIKFEQYSNEEAPKKEEPVIEVPTIETKVISKDEALLNTIIAQLGSLNNSLTAIYQKLEEINGNQEKEIHPQFG